MKLRLSALSVIFILFTIFKAAAFPSPVLFTGIQGTFAFPIMMIEKNSESFLISNSGGGIDAEFGVQFGKLQGTVEMSYAGSRSKKHLMKSFDTVSFGTCIFYELDKDLIPFFPKFLALRPGAEIALKVYTGENAYTESLRERGLYEKVHGAVPEYSLIFAVDFPGLLSIDSLSFVPFTSYEAIFSADTRGTVFSQHLGIGLRLFFNKIKNFGNVDVTENDEQTIIQENTENVNNVNIEEGK